MLAHWCTALLPLLLPSFIQVSSVSHLHWDICAAGPHNHGRLAIHHAANLLDGFTATLSTRSCHCCHSLSLSLFLFPSFILLCSASHLQWQISGAGPHNHGRLAIDLAADLLGGFIATLSTRRCCLLCLAPSPLFLPSYPPALPPAMAKYMGWVAIHHIATILDGSTATLSAGRLCLLCCAPSLFPFFLFYPHSLLVPPTAANLCGRSTHGRTMGC